jgi:hypothetical protein
VIVAQASLFAGILLSDVVQELSAIGNRLSLERDWVPALIDHDESGLRYSLTQMNAVIKKNRHALQTHSAVSSSLGGFDHAISCCMGSPSRRCDCLVLDTGGFACPVTAPDSPDLHRSKDIPDYSDCGSQLEAHMF